jgi:hypothetical protein
LDLLFSPTIRGAISLTIRSPFAVRGISLTPVWPLVLVLVFVRIFGPMTITSKPLSQNDTYMSTVDGPFSLAWPSVSTELGIRTMPDKVHSWHSSLDHFDCCYAGLVAV